MATSKVIFNQYYYDLLTKIRTIAKKHKDNSSTANKVLEVMKDNYKEFDKTSGEYVDFLNTNCNDDFWKSYLDIEKENCDDWLKKDDIKNVCIFKDISIGEIAKLLRDNFLCHHFLSVFYIYKNEMSDESASNILKILQTFSDDFELDNENYKKVINRLNTMKSEKVKENSSFEGMGELKDTTIGKIAKEIIEDVNIDKFKQTMSEEGDILKALANPENGLGELFSKVGNKVTDKISSGELNQDAIMKDAMKFASMLPSMFGNNGGGGGGNGDFNMADMMRMMGAMNGGGGGGGRKTKTAVNKNGLKALAKKAELQKKLASKR
jgi:ribosomal protein S17E